MDLSSSNTKRRYLEFERPLVELDTQIAKLKELRSQENMDVAAEIKALQKKADTLLEQTFQNLSPYQIVQLSRHPDRPSTLDYIEMMFSDFFELHGDRHFMDDRSIVGGLARFGERAVVVIGHQKGRNTQENLVRNFGMPRPEGYRKAHRLFELAERFQLPLITFIDTPGAYPGIEAEERGQAQAIADNIIKMCGLKVPILSVILGEGGSGGALAIAVADRLLMLEYSTYSVISPEGCAAITWKDGKFASQAAEALRLTANEIKNFEVCDRIVKEPLGGAHRDLLAAVESLKSALHEELQVLQKMSADERMKKRYERYRHLGEIREA